MLSHQHAMLVTWHVTDRVIHLIRKCYLLCFRLQTIFKMGSKFSKSQDKNNEEGAVAMSHESTKDGVLEKSPGFSRKLRSSCRNWATKKGLMRNNEASKSETDSVVRDVVLEEEFRQEVAYTCGEGEEGKDTPHNKDSDAAEVDISSVIKHLVIEAQKKKVASRPNSRVFSHVTKELLIECPTDTSEKEVTTSENEHPSEENMTKDTDSKKDIFSQTDLKHDNQKETADLIVVEKAKVVNDNSGGETVVISDSVDKFSGIVVADSAAEVFSSSQVKGKEENTLSLEGNIDNENGEIVEILCMDNVITRPEESKKEETELKDECEEMEKFIQSIIKEIVQDMIM